MIKPDLIKKKIEIAEKRILELLKSGDLKKLPEKEGYQISDFYKKKSENRLETAKIIYNTSKSNSEYKDYAEVVSAAYYSMYYIIQSFLALNYRIKFKEMLRGVHIITEYAILYYLIKTKKLATHFYEEYLKALETTAEIQKINIEDFQEQAYDYAEKYDKSRSAREKFTYFSNIEVEEYNAMQAINIAEEFNNTIKQLMIK